VSLDHFKVSFELPEPLIDFFLRGVAFSEFGNELNEFLLNFRRGMLKERHMTL
jgi:hypothetical protein